MAALIAMNRTEQLPFHIGKALDNRILKDELAEIVTHLAFYSGWPTAVSATRVAKEVLASRE